MNIWFLLYIGGLLVQQNGVNWLSQHFGGELIGSTWHYMYFQSSIHWCRSLKVHISKWVIIYGVLRAGLMHKETKNDQWGLLELSSSILHTWSLHVYVFLFAMLVTLQIYEVPWVDLSNSGEAYRYLCCDFPPPLWGLRYPVPSRHWPHNDEGRECKK